MTTTADTSTLPDDQSYWDDIATHALSFAYLANHTNSAHAAAHAAVDLHRRHGPGGLIDASAVMLSMARAGCPDHLRDIDGHPDADQLTATAHSELTAPTARATRTGARRADDAGRLTALRPAIGQALTADGPRTAAAALRPAADDKATVLVLFTAAASVLNTVATASREENR